MTKLALFVRLEAKPGQEAALADFLASAPTPRPCSVLRPISRRSNCLQPNCLH